LEGYPRLQNLRNRKPALEEAVIGLKAPIRDVAQALCCPLIKAMEIPWRPREAPRFVAGKPDRHAMTFR
jgi:hypothetical protein